MTATKRELPPGNVVQTKNAFENPQAVLELDKDRVVDFERGGVVKEWVAYHRSVVRTEAMRSMARYLIPVVTGADIIAYIGELVTNPSAAPNHLYVYVTIQAGLFATCIFGERVINPFLRVLRRKRLRSGK